jgi:hypothetical protein
MREKSAAVAYCEIVPPAGHRRRCAWRVRSNGIVLGLHRSGRSPMLRVKDRQLYRQPSRKSHQSRPPRLRACTRSHPRPSTTNPARRACRPPPFGVHKAGYFCHSASKIAPIRSASVLHKKRHFAQARSAFRHNPSTQFQPATIRTSNERVRLQMGSSLSTVVWILE